MNPSHSDRCDVCNDKRALVSASKFHAHAVACPACTEGDACPACMGTEFRFLRDERGYRYAVPCERCGPVKARVKRFNDARLPARYHEATFEGFITRDTAGQRNVGNLMDLKIRIFRTATSFTPGDQGFLLYGVPGCGKTHLLCAFIRYLTLEKGISARFIEFTHLLSTLREQFDRGRGDTTVIAPLISVPVLAIDELGKGVNNEWQLSVLDELISKRYNQGKTTLFTSNYPLDTPEMYGTDTPSVHMEKALRQTLSERIGDRIFSRLFEMTEFLSVDAPDYRARSLSVR
jgi:DNA replication protein DnaC